MENNEYLRNVADYLRAMQWAKSMLENSIITEEEYTSIDTIIANKYGINSCSIYRQTP